ncbi:MAG: neutral/alkaline non-lysosomal ceramidase N-terminal domain-containing protein [Mangrovibacterium sp.]|nr:neutral/alkaline non-lysosomal ceramidase N-terminal domain-containing protein [Mangrovibacterium sp.]
MMRKKRVITGMLALLISLFPGWILARNKAKSDNVAKVGVAQVNITPDKPTMMSGYAARITPSVGVHDSLYASAFCFSEDEGKSLLITADLIGFPNDFANELKELISFKIDVPVENIMLVAVHNHGGPSVGKNHDSESVREYTEILKNKLLNLAANASKKMEPFLMGAGKGRCNMNINRRAEFAEGMAWIGRNPDGPCDHELDVIRFETFDHLPIAVLINWPCHATVMEDTNYLITGDWPGAAARYIKKQIGGNIIVGVTAGASGDINSIYGPGDYYQEVDAVGHHIGKETMKVLSNIETYPVTDIRVTEKTVTFPGKMRMNDRLSHSTYEPGPDAEIKLSVMKIGNLMLTGISGEVMNEIGTKIKGQSPYSNTIVMTHCNGSSGYICTDEAFATGGYEVAATRLMPGAEKPLIKKVMEMIYSF